MVDLMDLYSAQALADAAGATYRQIDYWTKQGYLRPLTIHGSKKQGTGHQRVYGADEVTVARVLLAAHDLANTAERARDAVESGKSVTLVGMDGEPIIRLTIDVLPFEETGTEA
jgi:hypothetical protein